MQVQHLDTVRGSIKLPLLDAISGEILAQNRCSLSAGDGLPAEDRLLPQAQSIPSAYALPRSYALADGVAILVTRAVAACAATIGRRE